MTRTLLLLLLTLAGCTTPAVTADAGYTPTQTRLLGLNDVTFLLPLESLDAGTAFPPPVEIIPFSTFDRLTSATPRVQTDLSRLRVLAARFDICDRATPGPCEADADGVFRLVLQPVFGAPPRVEDVTFHAFFSVPRAEVPQVVDELRELAALQDVPRGAALRVNTADATSRQRLARLVTRYAKSARMHRLTLFGQETDRAALIWIFRGEERAPDTLGPIEIPGIATTSQEVLLFGGDSYVVTPVADFPSGFSRAVMESNFRNATTAQQLESVRSLLAIDNPSLHTANTVQCASCHLVTTLLQPRAADAGIDVTTQPESFGSPSFDLTPLGAQSARFRTLRALGYFNDTPLVSQRVINETVTVLNELEQRYPVASP
ncbi:MAG: hypothetical protein Q8N23_13520 [Archangium sp.]|nr:hypothetical protein [Archangium sp.]MDP3153692.1 hypothetical protein [Archangium sp.]MDP3569259.1 hypothetical protein [Archangium sp.]